LWQADQGEAAMTRLPLTDIERQFLSDSFASLSHAIAGHAPDRVFELIDRLTMLLALPQPKHWARFEQPWQSPRQTPKASHITEEEIGIALAWIDALACVYDSRTPRQVLDVTLKLKQLLHSLAVNDCQQLWREFDTTRRGAILFECKR
jgi:hypothetical protein